MLRAVVHEIGHAIGYWHEHQRPDRDEHVNVHPSVLTNFNNRKLSNFSVNSYGTPYDAISVMHYTGYGFKSKYGIELGGHELSPIDGIQARRMYRCPSGTYGCIINVLRECVRACVRV